MAHSQLLTPEQTRSLFDILTHHHTYSAIEAFKSTDGVLTHGFPFRNEKQQARAAKKAKSNAIAAPTPTPAPTSSSTGSNGVGGLTGFALSLWGGRSGSSGATPTPSAPDSPRTYTPQPPSVADLSLESGGNDGEDDTDEEEEDARCPSELPVLQLLGSTFVMRLPPIKTLPRDFWAVRIQGLLSRFAEADLSESYDKGTMGARKTLASGSSAIIEMISRGFLGGVGKKETMSRTGDGAELHKAEALKKKEYNLQDGQELVRAWEDVLDGLVYGDLVDDLFDHFTRTADLDAHSPAAEASVHYIVFHLASLLHHIFVRTPDGPYLLKLLDSVHRLIPYKMIKQTLRIGNAATMISGLMRLLLAKLSVTGLTNWLGVTQNDDDGMNLLQNIISLVLSRDASEFKKIVQRIDKMEYTDDDDDYEDDEAELTAAAAPSEEMLEAIRAHVAGPKTEHEARRRESVAARESIIVSIFRARDPALAAGAISEKQHALCLQYYSALLAIRDREAITRVLCRQPPDLFTRTLREVMAAYNPMIRVVHERVNMGDHLQDLQEFITEFLRVSTPGGKGKSGGKEAGMVMVEDYVKLLNDHKALLHKFIHALGKNCPEVWQELRAWSNTSIVRFRQETTTTTAAVEDDDSEEGKKRETTKETVSVMDQSLNRLVSGLDESTRAAVLVAVDAHARYLASLKDGSDARLAQLASQINSGGGGGGGSSSDASAASATTSGSCWAGPGVFLARWQDILDDTLITPSEARQKPPGALRHGSDVRHLTTLGKTSVAGGDLSSGGGTDSKQQQQQTGKRMAQAAPDVGVVVDELGGAFAALMQGVNMERRVFGKKQ